MVTENVFNVKIDRMGDVRCSNIATVLLTNLGGTKQFKYCAICYNIYGNKKVKSGKARMLVSSKTQSLGQCEAQPGMNEKIDEQIEWIKPDPNENKKRTYDLYPPESLDSSIKYLKWLDPTILTPSSFSWRTHPPGQHEAMETSVQRLGIITPLIARENSEEDNEECDYTLVDGQLRLQIAIKLKHETVPVAVLKDNVSDAACAEIALTTVAMPLLAEHDEATITKMLNEEGAPEEKLLRGTLEEFANPDVWELERVLTPLQREKSKKAALSENVLLLAGSLTVNAPPHVIEDIKNEVAKIIEGVEGATIT